MTTVKSILDQKGRKIWSVGPESTVFSALEMLAEHNIGAVLVLESGKLRGIFSERDFARFVVLSGKSPQEMEVSQIMTEDVVTIDVNESVVDCMEIFTSKFIRHLPVMESNEIVGIISIGDVVKEIISHQEFIIDQLESYIQKS